ncbi:MAG: NAD(P)/FAD-dependent oxidoreductase, partial [Deltaproteobacteria bacterium]|nr:NAD(P)/FAD-dependent oxidoreductase [Deltaproteobacteria bacterium]
RAYQGLAPIMVGPSIHGKNICYVICTGNQQYQPRAIFENVTTKGTLAWAFKNARIVKEVGCTLKTFNAMPVPWKGNVLAIGDAAAFVEVETQGALMCGYKAAHAIVEVMNGQDGLDRYTSWWQDSFEFNRADVMRVAQGFALVPKYTDEELDYLFGLLEGERLEGSYSQYHSPKIMWDAIMGHSERIQSERSEIWAKITGKEASLSDML